MEHQDHDETTIGKISIDYYGWSYRPELVSRSHKQEVPDDDKYKDSKCSKLKIEFI